MSHRASHRQPASAASMRIREAASNDEQSSHGDSADDEQHLDDEENAELEASHAAFLSANSSALPRAMGDRQDARNTFSSRSSAPSAHALAVLPFVQPFLESDAADPESDDDEPEHRSSDPLDDEEDEELADLRREYGKPASQASQALPALSEIVESIRGDEAQAAPKPVQLLRAHPPGTKAVAAADDSIENDAPEADDDWALLGVECDCPCTSCRVTLVAPEFDDHVRLQRQIKQELKESAEDDEGNALDAASSAVIPCECFELHTPECKHDLIVYLLEDFFRLRVHMHRITFAESMARAEARVAAAQQSTSAPRRKGQQRVNREEEADRVEELCRSAHTRALTLLKARCRRDLRHIELLEACANQLGWNHPSAPAFTPAAVFCEYASPAGLNARERSVLDELNPGSAVHRGGDLLSGIVVDFLLYFLPLKTTCSNFDKSRCATLLQHLLSFAIACHDLDPADRVTKEALAVCERSTMDLPLADLVETELAKFVQDRVESEAAAAAADKIKRGAAADAVAGAGAGSILANDADIFPGRASSSSLPSTPAVLEAFQGYFLIDSYSAPSALCEPNASRAPPLLHLRPAMKTRSKMHVYRELEKEDQEALQTNKGAAAAASSDAASSVSSGVAAGSSDSSRRPLQSSAPSLHCSSLLSVIVPHMVLELLTNASDEGKGWRLNLEITRYDSRDLRTVHVGQQEAKSTAPPLFHITKSGHVSCA